MAREKEREVADTEEGSAKVPQLGRMSRMARGWTGNACANRRAGWIWGRQRLDLRVAWLCRSDVGSGMVYIIRRHIVAGTSRRRGAERAARREGCAGEMVNGACTPVAFSIPVPAGGGACEAGAPGLQLFGSRRSEACMWSAHALGSAEQGFSL